MTHHHSLNTAQPLTLAQLDFWEEFRLHPGEAVSTVAHALELCGPVDGDALARAIRTLLAEADVLSLRLSVGPDGAPRQTVDPARRPVLRRIDLADEPDPMGRAMAMMRQDLTAPLDLLDQPISAQWLLRLGADRWVWYNRGHHIALDGYAMGLIEARAARLYAAALGLADAGAPLAPLAAYLQEEAQYRASPRHQADGRHWQGMLAALPAPRVLAKGSEDYAEAPLAQETDLSPLRGPLLATAEAAGIGWPDLLTVLCGAWCALALEDGSAARRRDGAGRVSVPVWLPYLSRMGSVAIRVPALVVNILPFDVTLAPSEPLGPALVRLAGQLRRLRRHGRYRIEQIGADHGLGAQQRFFFSPLINVLPFEQARFAGCDTRRHVLSNGPGDGFNITLRADPEARGLHLDIEADPALTPAAAFARHARGLPAFLARALEPGAGSRPIGALCALAAEPA